ncbi:MAG: thermonuclease family protein [Thermodesulfobacteriota bacterium]
MKHTGKVFLENSPPFFYSRQISIKVLKERFLAVPIPVLVFLAFFIVSCSPGVCYAEGKDGPARSAYVIKVVDGDTVILAGGETVRYIGIDTPEFGEPFYLEAKEMNGSLVKGSKVRLIECRGEKLDRYGRTLAWVYVDGRFVNGELLREGLAKALIIPPCGLERLREVRALEEEAKRAGKGIWGAGVNRDDFKKLFK